ncbi:MAG TPA: anti-sigma factor antagonist [Gammaproteobacteria bacterium]|nr:anti-sigma factor antagonist [Gammaproteobacteria bacterium]
MGIQVSKSEDSNLVTISVNGRFDFSLHKAFREAYKNEPATTPFVVNMSGADYMDSSALGMLLMLREHLDSNVASVRIEGCQPAIRQILEISKFEKLFEIA